MLCTHSQEKKWSHCGAGTLSGGKFHSHSTAERGVKNAANTGLLIDLCDECFLHLYSFQDLLCRSCRINIYVPVYVTMNDSSTVVWTACYRSAGSAEFSLWKKIMWNLKNQRGNFYRAFGTTPAVHAITTKYQRYSNTFFELHTVAVSLVSVWMS